MPERRSYFAAAQVGADVYVAGGMVGASGAYVLRLERFDPRADRWTREPDLPGEARAAAGAALRGKFYVIGGQTSKGVSRHTYAFDPKTHRWSVRAPLPAPRYNAAAATLDGTLYVAGGVSDIDPVRTVFAYDAGTNRWRLVAPLPRSAHTLALVAYRGGSGRSAVSARQAMRCGPCGSTRHAHGGGAPDRGSPRRSQCSAPSRRAGASTPSRSGCSRALCRAAAGRSARRSRCRAMRSASSPVRAGCGRSAAASCPNWPTAASSSHDSSDSATTACSRSACTPADT